MKKIILSLLLCLTVTPVFAEKAILVRLPNGKFVGVVYTATGNIVLTDVQILEYPGPAPNPTPNPVTTKVDRVTYLYDENKSVIPGPVAVALSKLNAQKIVATEFEIKTIDKDGDVPDQYKVAVVAAKEKGLPCLVVESKGVAIRVIENPKTEVSVMEAVK